MLEPHISLIAAVGRNGVIGQNGKLPWHCPLDVLRYRALTQHAPTLIGRNTFDRLPPASWPRRGVVVTPNYADVVANASRWDAHVFRNRSICVRPTLLSALSTARAWSRSLGVNYCWVAGGAALYENALSIASTLVLTVVDAEPAGDAYFPLTPQQLSEHPNWLLQESTAIIDPHTSHSYRYQTYSRRV